jgi:SecD/SecF fusion protein
MIMISAAFTLTGVAGLALTLGMAVDANVLIYERLREELQRGATLRMAIRNGFARAMTTIIDSNLTTLITAVVLYVVGTDQIKGFAVTLTLGLVISLFTSIFCSRVVLDIFEKQRWITTLNMMQFVGITNIDFIGKWRMAAAASFTVIAIGLVAVAARGKNMLDIDFLGGSSIQILFNEPQKIADVRERLSNVPDEVKQQTREELEQSMTEELRADAREELGAEATQEQIDQWISQRLDQLADLRDVAVSGVKLPDEPDGLRFNFNTSNPNIRAVETIVKDLFPGELAHNSMKYEPIAMISAEEARKTGTGTQRPPAPTTNSTGGQPGQPPAEKSNDSPASPGSNQGAAVERLDGQLLARADLDQELALLTQNQNDAQQPAESDKAEAEKSDATKSSTEASSGSTSGKTTEQFAKTTLTFEEKVNYDTVTAKLKNAMDQAGLSAEFGVSHPQYTEGSNVPFNTWEVRMATSASQLEELLQAIQKDMDATPVFPASTNIGGKVAGSTRLQAVYALLASLVLIVAYIWFRFERVVFGLAAVVALVHDVTISLGAIAVSYYLAQWLGPVASALQIDPFKIDLTIVAALLTIVGYSLNDTIVVFDRIREVRGKSPNLSIDMLNLSINQTLSRTILTGLTTMFVLVILYFWGGQGIHGFAYCLLIGMIVGTYSSIYVASPILLWLMQPRRAPASERMAAEAGRGSPNFSKSLPGRERA